MKRTLKPAWSAADRAAAQKAFARWDAFFARRQRARPLAAATAHAADAALAQVQARHEARLLRYPNVVGVAAGLRTRRGRPTAQPCLVVYVTRKLPRKQLPAHQRLPRRLDGVPVDVVEIGALAALAGVGAGD
ncbi:MAG: hypothetical protein NZL99_10885 [Burkholderiaceae bacterium]|nr:hypothetical protein [Burkholderiaceae bacterium]